MSPILHACSMILSLELLQFLQVDAAQQPPAVAAVLKQNLLVPMEGQRRPHHLPARRHKYLYHIVASIP